MERTSSGSDWSDVDEISTARFSQEEPVPLKPSTVPEASAFPEVLSAQAVGKVGPPAPAVELEDAV